MLALRSAPPVFSAAEAERIARDAYGLAVEASPLPGERDCNFRLCAADGREHVLKIFDIAADPHTADCQIRVLHHLAEQDSSLPVPRIVPTPGGMELGETLQADSRYATLLLGLLPGRLVIDVQADWTLLKNTGQMLGRLDHALRGFFHPALAQHIAWDVRRLPELAAFAAYLERDSVRCSVRAVIQSVERRLPSLRALRSQAVHGDCHGANLLVDTDGQSICGVLDFGDMIHAPVALEPAVAMAEFLSDGAAPLPEIAALVEGFAAVQALENADIDALYDLVTGRLAATLLLHAWRLRHDPSGAQMLESGAARAATALEAMREWGRDRAGARWHDAAHTATSTVAEIDLGRRHRLMGAGAELFYDPPLHVVQGRGVWLYDAAGRAYLDAYNNVPHVGHCHPRVVQAVQRQTAALATHTRYLHSAVLQYAEQLLARCSSALNACLFVNSGSEANDVAFRLARFASGRSGALVMAHAYHGITDGAAALTYGTGSPLDSRVAALSAPSASPHHAMTAAQITATESDVDDALLDLATRGIEPAAFFLDTALTSSGIVDAPPDWLVTVAAKLRSARCLVIADEVQYGLGRSGTHFWGFERRGLSTAALAPDIVTLGKPAGNGYPIGVVIAHRDLIEAFQARFGFFSTFGGNPVAAAAGLAVLDVLDRERLMENARTTGAYLRERLQQVAGVRRCLGAVRGQGLLLGLEVRADDAAVAKARTRALVNRLAADARVLTGVEGPTGTIVKLRPPMPFSPRHADRLVAAVDAAAAAIDAGHGAEGA
ncbi:MAG: aminotransferase class III-fold pyridoxal phosphate-dependent enzyme [Pseudomonadota bacterium]|nr:aminotransferase class III-fold pyridoxal phosphate-dependent enzyme [Pseudomonadota bacterium]